MTQNYKAIAIGLNKRKLVPESELISELSNLYSKDPKQDYYYSIYKYTQKHYDDFKKTHTLAGISDVKTNTLVFDFDSKSNIEAAKLDALTLIGRLTQKGITKENISVYFSGQKGVHVEVASDQDFTQTEANAIRKTLAGDLESNDTSISDVQRVIRAPLSRHNKSGLYKIPLTVDELAKLSVEQIADSAKELTDSHYDMVDQNMNKRITLPIDIVNLKNVKEKKKEIVASDKLDFSRNKTGLTNAKFALSEGYFEEGERHEAVMILAATYLGLGWHKELAYNNIKATLRLRARRLGLDDVSDETKQEVWKEVESVFGPLWKGGMFGEDKNELLIKTKQRYGITDRYENSSFINIPEVDDVFKDFAANIDKNTIKLGITSFDKEVRVTTSTLVMLLAPPATGKTSITFGILNATSKHNIKSMFFSLDMAAPQVYQRLAQRHTALHSDKIFEAYKNNDTSIINRISDTLSEEYKNVKFCFKGAMSIETIRENILKQKEVQGEFPKLVVIDYLENITTSFSDSSASKAFAARSLKDMANEFGICIFLLVQPRLSGGDGSSELNSYTDIKGSSVLSETASQIFSMYRPGFNPKNSADDNFISITVVKNRMGQLGRFDYHWTGLTGAIRELTHEERGDLKSLLEQKAAEKKGMDDL